MKTGENITEAMIPEFELSPEMERKATAWAALNDLANGLTPEDIFTLYGLTVAQVEPYRAEWETTRPAVHV